MILLRQSYGCHCKKVKTHTNIIVVNTIISNEIAHASRTLLSTTLVINKTALAGSLLLSLTNGRVTTPKVKVERGNLSPPTGQTCHSMTKSVSLE